MDYSLTNSKRGLLAMQLTLMCQGLDTARRVAGLVGDPPDAATYIGEDSVVCTPEDQELAYFLKALLLDETPGPAGQAGPSSEGRAFERMLLEAIWAGDRKVFLHSLRQLLLWYNVERQAKEHRRDLSWWICVPGLGCSVLAVSRTLIGPDELPKSETCLPVALAR